MESDGTSLFGRRVKPHRRAFSLNNIEPNLLHSLGQHHWSAASFSSIANLTYGFEISPAHLTALFLRVK